jgi:iron-sulfur cluster assembly protein
VTLTLTENASSVIRALSEKSELAEEAGLRIAGSDDDGQQTDLAVALVMTPRHQDQVIEQEGARVFLDPTAANLLEDKVLDATVDDDGKVRFLMTAPPGQV